jgi:hypothetical protein
MGSLRVHRVGSKPIEASKVEESSPLPIASEPLGLQNWPSPEVTEKIIYVPTIKEVKVVEEKFIEVIKEIFIDRPYEVIKEVKVIEEKIVEVIKEVPVIVEKFIEIEKFIDKEIHKIPTWMWGLVGCETLLVIVLLLK